MELHLNGSMTREKNDTWKTYFVSKKWNFLHKKLAELIRFFRPVFCLLSGYLGLIDI